MVELVRLASEADHLDGEEVRVPGVACHRAPEDVDRQPVIQPLDDAKETELQLQVMLTKGESIKGNPRKGMLGNYFERKVILKVAE